MIQQSQSRSKPLRALRRSIATLLAAAAYSSTQAADSSALLDALVRKGVLTDKEAAAIP